MAAGKRRGRATERTRLAAQLCDLCCALGAVATLTAIAYLVGRWVF